MATTENLTLTTETMMTFPPETRNDANTSLTPDVLKRINLCIGIIGFLGNLKVVVVMVTSKSLLKAKTNIYITSQSCLDAFVALMLLFTIQFEDDGR